MTTDGLDRRRLYLSLFKQFGHGAVIEPGKIIAHQCGAVQFVGSFELQGQQPLDKVFSVRDVAGCDEAGRLRAEIGKYSVHAIQAGA